MQRKEELKGLLDRLAQISQETFLGDCPKERLRELHQETKEILARINVLEDQQLREKTAALYSDDENGGTE